MRAHLAAAGAIVGSLVLFPVPSIVVVLCVGAALARRSGLLVVVAMAVMCSWLGVRALDGLAPPPATEVGGWLTLVSDPRPFGTFGVRASAVWDGHRVAVTAHGPVAGRLDDASAGEQVRVTGRFRAASPHDEWARWRHEVGSISIDRLVERRPGAPVTRVANAMRGLLATGAEGLGPDDRAVFLGMVIGDDREQSAVVADDFRAGGLGHLLVVSGQNIAFVIAVVTPLVRRLRPGPRLVVLGAALAFFSLLTRFEPSVLRAAGMAGVSLGAAAIGTPVDGRRALSAAVAALLVVDPFLVHVLAFRLSVAATAGIVWLGQPLADRLPGPEPLRVAASATIAAQLAVSPLLVATFGPLPLASLPANLLAGPASGPIMVWGCTAGLIAGLGGETVADTIHVPTRLAVGWVRVVARGAAAAPAAVLGPVALILIAVTVTAVARRVPLARVVLAVVALGSVGSSIAGAPEVSPGSAPIGAGVTVVGGESVVAVVLRDPARPAQVVEVVREAGVRRIDLVVATDGDLADALAVVALADRHGPAPVVLAPPMHRVPGASSVAPGSVVRWADLDVWSVADGDTVRLSVCAPAPCHDGHEEVPP